MISRALPLQGYIRASGYHGQLDTPSDSRMSIAISRETGTRGSAIAKVVGSRLGWPVYDHQLLELIASNLQVRIDRVEAIDERTVSWLTEAVQDLGAVPYVKEAQYVHRLIEALSSLAKTGHCIVVGRGSPFVMPLDTTLRVRLHAPLPDRIAKIREDLCLTEATALDQINRVDRARIQFIKSHFFHDPADPHHYDLVINTADHSIEECADLIVEGLGCKSARLASQQQSVSA